MKKFNIVREHGVVIHGRSLPIGSVYGQIDVFYPVVKHDDKGNEYTVTMSKKVIFVCENFKSHGWGYRYDRNKCAYTKARHLVYDVMIYDYHGKHKELLTYTVGSKVYTKTCKTTSASWHHAMTRKQYSAIGEWLDKMLVQMSNCENNHVHTVRDCHITGRPTEKKAQVIQDSSFKAGKIGYVLNTHVVTDYAGSERRPFADFKHY